MVAFPDDQAVPCIIEFSSLPGRLCCAICPAGRRTAAENLEGCRHCQRVCDWREHCSESVSLEAYL